MVQTLEKLHSVGMTHNDLKLENIMIGDINMLPILGQHRQAHVNFDQVDCSTARIVDF